MLLSEYVWLCKVKGHCESDRGVTVSAEVPEETQAEPVSVIENPVALDQQDSSQSEDPADGVLQANDQTTPELNTLSVRTGVGQSIAAEDGFGFSHSSVLGRFGKSEDRDFWSRLSAYMRDHPGSDLEIIGQYHPDEDNKTSFPNLGLARADFAADQLIRQGLEAGRMIKSYRKLPAVQDGYGIEMAVIAEQDFTQTDNSLFESRQIYFETNSSEIDFNDDLRSYLTSAIQYLKQHPEGRLKLIGHTDNTGDAGNNQRLGLVRAKQIADLFSGFGLNRNRIDTDSKGELEPIESNSTEQGRAKNRRVEILLQTNQTVLGN